MFIRMQPPAVELSYITEIREFANRGVLHLPDGVTRASNTEPEHEDFGDDDYESG